MSLAVLFIGAIVASFVGTGLVRRYAVARRVLDVPNERSSHRMPTPRGGGVAIVVVFVAGLALLVAMHRVVPALAVALAGAGLLVAAVGFLDDHAHIAARWRLLAHFGAAAWALAWLGGAPPVAVGAATYELGIVGEVLAAISLVWLLNLYNFMDGIDGIAGVEAVTTCTGSIALCLASGASDAWLVSALLGCATLGFLLWNFPPARIFMGDAGSGFLGITLGVLAVESALVEPRSLWSWIILLAVFIVDATVTLIVRLRRGDRVHEAHRTHAYQHAARRLGSHRPVTIAVAAINVLWLLPWAVLVGSGHVPAVVGLVTAYTPVLWLVVRHEAGRLTS